MKKVFGTPEHIAEFGGPVSEPSNFLDRSLIFLLQADSELAFEEIMFLLDGEPLKIEEFLSLFVIENLKEEGENFLPPLVLNGGNLHGCCPLPLP